MSKPVESTEDVVGTTLTIGELEQAVIEDAGCQGKLKSWKSEQIAKGQGFLSMIVKVDLEWETSSDHLPDQVVIKTPMQDNFIELLKDFMPPEVIDHLLSDKQADILKTLYCNEIEALKFLSDVRIGIKTLKMLYWKDYLNKENQGFMVLESLFDKACLQNMCDGFSLEQVKSVISALAHVQAKAITDESWKSKLKVFAKDSMEQMLDMWDQSKLIALDEEKFKNVVPKLGWAIKKERFMDLFTNESANASLVHGDMHGNNLMFAKDKDGHAGDELLGLIDWQGTHPGNVMEDLGRLIIGHLAPDIRRKETENLLKYYLEVLTTSLGDYPCPFTIDTLTRMWKQYFPVGMAILMMTTPMFLNLESFGGSGEVKERRTKLMIERTYEAMVDCIQLEEKEHISKW